MRAKSLFALSIAVILITARITAREVSIRLFSSTHIKSFIISPESGEYDVYGDGELLFTGDPSYIFHMSIDNDSVYLKTFEEEIGNYAIVKVLPKSGEAAFRIKSVEPLSKVRTYFGGVEVKLYTNRTEFLVLNDVAIDNYVAGVVQSESGISNNLEYYKLQAIICRTYSLNNHNRHFDEGYDLCDGVHCQAYYNKTTDSTISKAVQLTKGLVVVDSDLNLITAAFHSNCGGQTCNSEDVWLMPTPYLKSIKDPYCQNKNHAHWRKEIPIATWNKYVMSKSRGSKTASIGLPFNQHQTREVYYTSGGARIPLKTIRSDFRLKSTLFSVCKEGNVVVLKGRGYGHGVGLCQEGAMTMSTMKFSYEDILQHYYKGVSIIALNDLNYFKQE